MTSLLHTPPAVHSNYEVLPPAIGTVPAGDYSPSAGDLLYELGREIGLDGGTTTTVEVDGSWAWTPADRLRWTMGVRAGQEERKARELGRSLGESGSGISEPPAGLSPAERAAYRLGYAEGLEDFERGEAMAEDLDWIMGGRDEAMDAMYRVTDDRLPMGVMD